MKRKEALECMEKISLAVNGTKTGYAGHLRNGGFFSNDEELKIELPFLHLYGIEYVIKEREGAYQYHTKEVIFMNLTLED